MPMLDVGFVLLDPMIADTFDVERRAEVIGTDGRVTTSKTEFPKQRGVVTQQDPADLTRRDDGQMVPRVIEINSRFQFREATKGFQPDRVTWNGGKYLVMKVYPWSNFGAGFCRVTLESVTAMDPPQ